MLLTFHYNANDTNTDIQQQLIPYIKFYESN